MSVEEEFIDSIMEHKTGYNKREWFNDEQSPSTGNVIAFDGFIHYNGEPIRRTFLQISDCNNSIRLHTIEDDTSQDFINKMIKLRNVIDDFINYLRNVE